MNKLSEHVSRKELSEATGLTESEVTVIVRHYNIHRDDAGNIHFANFLKHAFMFQKEFCALPELAEMFAIEERQINKLEKAGKLNKVARGIYDRKDTVKKYILLLREQIERRGSDTFEEAELRYMRSRAEQKEIEVAKLKKQIINIPDGEHAIKNAVVVTVQRLRNVKVEAYPRLDNIPTQAERQDELGKLIDEALIEVVYLPAKLKELAHRSEKHDTQPEEQQPQPTPSGVGRTKTKSKPVTRNRKPVTKQ